MTNYSEWDAKASMLVREAEEQENFDKEFCDRALGLQDGPKGPPTEQAKAQLSQLDNHSKERLGFIDWSKTREVTLTHTFQEQPIELTGPEVDGKAVRLSGSEDVTYVVRSGIVKLTVDKCRRICIFVLDTIVTSTVELYACSGLGLRLGQPLGTLQVDECIQTVTIVYAERDYIGCVYHQNSPGLSISCAGNGPASQVIGSKGAVQLCSRLCPEGSRELLWTSPVRRGEGEFPIDLPSGADEAPMTPASSVLPEPEVAPLMEDRQTLASQRRQMGNNMFRANDFMNATVHYTEALHLDPAVGAVWANRAQCWLKLGNHEKALADAQQCTELDPANPKGWFRKGISFHAMQRHTEAIPALLEAERLEPHNTTITDAIRMTQHMVRKNAAGA